MSGPNDKAQPLPKISLRISCAGRIIPQEPTPPPSPQAEFEPLPLPSPSPPTAPEPTLVTTESDKFGLYHVYSTSPTAIPDEEVAIDDVFKGPRHQASMFEEKHPLSVFGLRDPDQEGLFALFLNATVFRFMNWWYGPSNTKTMEGLDSLVHDIVLADDFNCDDLIG
ncbi:hypothetical protein E1B28_012839 [Marasmius oreades]|uniref:Uncharacterized protein n=1 Tax=Marasmius oreades TaxID=181124 RepID=A0A9P7UR83_9AGAR|nr:uncharacterized protein E1B28_012839 [Marasmius oreades]KAG7088894.1 hypothetical protein E1B28_012839 [Marasmius oreades]